MKKTIVILHGWQSKLERWRDFKSQLEKDYQVFLPSIPGFGSLKLDKPYTLKDYCSWLDSFLAAKQIQNPVLIGHSHGGRIALDWVSRQKANRIDSLVLIASAGIKASPSLKRVIGLVLAKTGNVLFLLPPLSLLKKSARFLLYKFLREKDYYQADKVLQKTMKNMLQTDLTDRLAKIKTRTLLLWGAKDSSTPLKNGFLMEKKIAKAKLMVWEDEGHGLPFSQTKEVVKVIKEFLNYNY